MTKFVGKFRKNQDYNDDYFFVKKLLRGKKRKREHSEIKKQKKRCNDEEFGDFEISHYKKS